MSRPLRYLLSALIISTLAFTGCKGEEDYAEPEAFSFVVYPEARYLGQLTESTKQAHRVLNPSQEPPPTAIYDTDAPVEQVAEFYAEKYGYNGIAPESENAVLRVSKPQAYYRSGDLHEDAKAIEELLRKMQMPTDISKAQGRYRAAEIAAKAARPRVTIVRPYFDVTTSEVVDRTMILMSR